MILPKKNVSPLSRNSSDTKIREFIITINSLNYSIKEVYKDFIKNVEKEYNLINLIESNLEKSNKSLIEIINYLRIYIDLDKKSLDDFFEEAKTIFKKMKIIFNSLKQLIYSNHQYLHINNIFPRQLKEKENKSNLNNNSVRYSYINNAVKIVQKARTPIKSRTPINSVVSLTSQNSFKKMKLEISEKDKEIKNLNHKLKILEKNNTELYKNFNLTSIQKIENDKKLKEITKKYEELQIKYSQLEQNCYDLKSDENKNSNYEEEFDLKMMAKGVREKNFSQDMNIDNPGLFSMKEKIKDVIYKYNTLVELVKNLLPTINKNNENEYIIDSIIKIIFELRLKI